MHSGTLQLFVLFNIAVSSSALPLTVDVTGLINSLKPQPGDFGDPRAEIKCYGLPYGGIGFTSHVLTCWTFYWVSKKREPLWPPRQLKHQNLDVVLALLAVFMTVPLAAYTMVRCRQTDQFMFLAVWKMITSLTMGLTMIWPTRKWLCLYAPGFIVGMIGALWLAAADFHTHPPRTLAIITGAFAVLILMSWGALWRCDIPFLVAGLSCVTVLPAFYSDWCLASIAGNWSGFPSSDAAVLYWVYFVAKRLPLFSL